MSVNQGPLVDQLNELIQDCIRGNRHSQTILYESFAPRMFMVCQRYCKSREEAEEVLQEGFIKVFEHLSQFKHNGSFEGWMRKIMVNCALQKYRSKTQLHVVMSTEAANSFEPMAAEDITAQLGKKELLSLVQQLPPAYRLVFNLYVFEGLKHREIAELLGISEGTSKSNLSDARALLQKAITKSLSIAKKKIN